MIKNNISCFDCPNSNCFIKNYCSTEMMQQMDEIKIINRFSKKQLIFHEGNPTDGIYFIQKGIIKIVKKGAFEKNQIVRVSTAGDFLGHRGFSSNNTYPVSAESVTDSMVCFVGKKFFYRILEETPKLTINLMLFLADEINYEEARLRDMSIFNVREKVAKALIMLFEKFGLNDANQINHLEELNRQDIAELVGLNPNQVTKILAELKEDKIIETDNKKIKIIDLKKLEKIISL